jgi:hypothetical protein
MVYAIALDPGGTTGVAIVKEPEHLWHVTVDELTGDHHRKLFQLLHTSAPSFVICESFENRGMSNTSIVSMEYIGIVKLYLQQSGASGIWQSASTGKAFWTGAKLKEYGLYVAGLRHARDAIRHYAAWRTFTNQDRSLLEEKTKGQVYRV